MAQFFGKEILKRVDLVGSQLRLNSGSHVKIGGQGYNLTSDIYVDLPTLTAVTRYYVYLKTVNNVPQLEILTTPPSSNATKILVSAFLSNDDVTPTFGSFINIAGTPATNWIKYTPTINLISNINAVTGRFQIIEGTCFFQGCIDMAGPSGSALDISIYLPSNLLWDLSLDLANNTLAPIGTGWCDKLYGTHFVFSVFKSGLNYARFLAPAHAIEGDDFGANPFYISTLFHAPITGWLTPLKDL